MLIERIMGLNSDGSPMNTPEEAALKISVHKFSGYVTEVIQNAQAGNGISLAAMKTQLNLSAEDITELDALAATFPSTLAGRALMSARVHGVFLLAASREPGYSTPAEVRAKLGI